MKDVAIFEGVDSSEPDPLDFLIAFSRLGEDGARALKAEAGRRVEQGQWYGRVFFASVIIRKPA